MLILWDLCMSQFKHSCAVVLEELSKIKWRCVINLKCSIVLTYYWFFMCTVQVTWHCLSFISSRSTITWCGKWRQIRCLMQYRNSCWWWTREHQGWVTRWSCCSVMRICHPLQDTTPVMSTWSLVSKMESSFIISLRSRLMTISNQLYVKNLCNRDFSYSFCSECVCAGVGVACAHMCMHWPTCECCPGLWIGSSSVTLHLPFHLLGELKSSPVERLAS